MRLVRLLAIVVLSPLVLALSSPPPSAPTPMQQLFMLKEVKPDVKKVGVLWNENSSQRDALMPKIKRAAATTQLELYISYVGSIKDVGPRFRKLIRENEIDVLWLVENDGVVDTQIAQSFLIENAAKSGLPIVAPSADWVNKGAAITFIEGAEGVQFVVNESVAKATSIVIPEKYQQRTEFLTMN